jgi:hypothetical protein
MECELGRAPDCGDCLVRVLDSGQFDDDPAVTGQLEGGFGDAEGVDSPPQDLEGPRRHLGVHVHFGRVLGLEHDLGAAAQVEPEVDRQLEDGIDRDTDEQQREEQPGLGNLHGRTWVGGRWDRLQSAPFDPSGAAIATSPQG